MFKTYSDLTKFGIVIFVLLAGLAGYATSFAVENSFDWHHLVQFLGGLYFLSSGSLALNQVQEFETDKLMPRTSKRPLVTGKIKPAAAAILSLSMIVAGSDLLFRISPISAYLGWLTVVLYNGFYTYWWKRKWVFGAVPGAIPGALPATIGFAANNENIFAPESIYLFLIMFLWQMPHFWCLALKYKNDYAEGGVPTLSVSLGTERTIYHMGLYTFAYVAVAACSPWFVHASWIYLAIVLPIGIKVMQEFYRFAKSKGEKRWLAFFMWINVSMLVFIFVPVFDKWAFLLQR